MTPFRSLALALLVLPLLAVPALAADQAKETGMPMPLPVDPDDDPDLGFHTPPPAASAADRALWEAGRAVRSRMRVVRIEAVQLQRGGNAARVLERLEAAAATRPAEEAKPILDLRDRLKAAWKDNYTILARPWPINPIRGCASPVLMLESAITATGGKEKPELASARRDLKQCTELAEIGIKAMQASTAAFKPVLDQAVRRLAELDGGGGASPGKNPQSAAPAPTKGPAQP